MVDQKGEKKCARTLWMLREKGWIHLMRFLAQAELMIIDVHRGWLRMPFVASQRGPSKSLARASDLSRFLCKNA